MMYQSRSVKYINRIVMNIQNVYTTRNYIDNLIIQTVLWKHDQALILTFSLSWCKDFTCQFLFDIFMMMLEIAWLQYTPPAQ